ncbi:MAG: hypothetical protein ACKO5E_15805 [bacterium]
MTSHPAETSPPSAPAPARPGHPGRWLALGLAVLCVLAILVWLALSTRETRAGVTAYTRLTAAVNTQDIEKVRSLCTARYLATHQLRASASGGMVGFPRFIHKNFQAWREGDAVWLCPTNRVGPIYQFLKEDGEWKYDGLIGLLRSGNQILVMPEESRQSGDDEMLPEG